MSGPEEDHVHHGIDYVELTVPDVPEARRFHSAAFGWDFADHGPTYAGIRDPSGREVGGLAVGERPGTGGRRFHVTDPGGTELGVWALR